MLSDSFASADTNGDGYLSKSEYLGAREDLSTRNDS